MPLVHLQIAPFFSYPLVVVLDSAPFYHHRPLLVDSYPFYHPRRGQRLIGALNATRLGALNATTFSPPQTRVEIRGNSVGHGFAVEIEDRGGRTFVDEPIL